MVGAPSMHDKNMCTGCAGYCCTLLVELTSYDVFRIMLAEGKQAKEFVRMVYASPDDAFAFKTKEGMMKLALISSDDKCIYLRPKEKLKCAIERSKPSICLAYPFFLKDRQVYALETARCPRSNRIRADLAKMSIKTLFDCKWEFDRYREIVDDWNFFSKNDGTADEFLLFASEEMHLEMSFLGSLKRKMKRALLRIRTRKRL